MSYAGPIALVQQQHDLKVADLEILRLVLDRTGEVGSGSLELPAGDVKSAAPDPARSVVRPRTDDVVERGLGLVPLLPLHQDASAGQRVDTERDGIESRSALDLRRTTELLQSLPAFPPGRVVEHPDRALGRRRASVR